MAKRPESKKPTLNQVAASLKVIGGRKRGQAKTRPVSVRVDEDLYNEAIEIIGSDMRLVLEAAMRRVIDEHKGKKDR